jgi:hypothetical protein
MEAKLIDFGRSQVSKNKVLLDAQLARLRHLLQLEGVKGTRDEMRGVHGSVHRPRNSPKATSHRAEAPLRVPLASITRAGCLINHTARKEEREEQRQFMR